MELPPTLYGEDLMNGNCTSLMTQSCDPATLTARLTDNQQEDEMSVSSSGGDLMSQSADCSILRNNLNDRISSSSYSPARPRTLFSNRGGSTDSGIRSDCDQLELLDISDSEGGAGQLQGGGTPYQHRLQSRLNPVPESLNSPDIAPGTGPSPPRRDDPMISGPLSLDSLPPSLENRLNAARTSSVTVRPSEVMVAAVTARAATPKTPKTPLAGLTRPTSAVRPSNIISKVDSGLARGGAGRTPVPRPQRSHSAGPARRAASLPNRQVNIQLD